MGMRWFQGNDVIKCIPNSPKTGCLALLKYVNWSSRKEVLTFAIGLI